ncbi:hypothetical protein [Pontibacillus yanchengensis]|nr:hypothetical protein [Pontibacillus yanchengensis]
MGRGKGYKEKKQNHEHEKPLSAKQFAEVGEEKPKNMHNNKGGAIKE